MLNGGKAVFVDWVTCSGWSATVGVEFLLVESVRCKRLGYLFLAVLAGVGLVPGVAAILPEL
jgi:hypothetical protein